MKTVASFLTDKGNRKMRLGILRHYHSSPSSEVHINTVSMNTLRNLMLTEGYQK